jgi:hypothetical protein
MKFSGGECHKHTRYLLVISLAYAAMYGSISSKLLSESPLCSVLTGSECLKVVKKSNPFKEIFSFWSTESIRARKVVVPIFVLYLHVTSLKALAAFLLDVLFYSEYEKSTALRNVGDLPNYQKIIIFILCQYAPLIGYSKINDTVNILNFCC